MDRLVEYAYDKFFLRDLLGYILPGTLIIGLILYSLGRLGSLWTDVKNSPKVYFVAVLAGGYIAGLVLQAAGTFYGERQEWPLVRFYLPQEQQAAFLNELESGDVRAPLARINSALYREYCYSIEQRQGAMRDSWLATSAERFSTLKAVHGNIALSFLGSAVTLLVLGVVNAAKRRWFAFWPQLASSIALFLIGLLMLHEHAQLLERQFLFKLATRAEQEYDRAMTTKAQEQLRTASDANKAADDSK